MVVIKGDKVFEKRDKKKKPKKMIIMVLKFLFMLSSLLKKYKIY
jgi:hypothetical protein